MPDGGTKQDCHNCRFIEYLPTRKFCGKHRITLPYTFEIICRNYSFQEKEREISRLKPSILYYYFYPIPGSYEVTLESFKPFSQLQNRIWVSFISYDYKYGWIIKRYRDEEPGLEQTFGTKQLPSAGNILLIIDGDKHKFEVTTELQEWGTRVVNTTIIYSPSDRELLLKWAEANEGEEAINKKIEMAKLTEVAEIVTEVDQEGIVWKIPPVEGFNRLTQHFKVLMEEVEIEKMYYLSLFK